MNLKRIAFRIMISKIEEQPLKDFESEETLLKQLQNYANGLNDIAKSEAKRAVQRVDI